MYVNVCTCVWCHYEYAINNNVLFIRAQLLGELYSDREYLDKLMKDPGK